LLRHFLFFFRFFIASVTGVGGESGA